MLPRSLLLYSKSPSRPVPWTAPNYISVRQLPGWCGGDEGGRLYIVNTTPTPRARKANYCTTGARTFDNCRFLLLLQPLPPLLCRSSSFL